MFFLNIYYLGIDHKVFIVNYILSAIKPRCRMMINDLFDWLIQPKPLPEFPTGDISRADIIKTFELYKSSTETIEESDPYYIFLAKCTELTEARESVHSTEIAVSLMNQPPFQPQASICVFNKMLCEQPNPTGILPLFNKYIYDVEQLAAALVYCCRREVDPHVILQAQLIQKCFAYDLPFLDSEHSAVKNLFSILKKYPETSDLLKACQSTSCGIRGHEHLNLLGETHDELDEVALLDSYPVTINPSVENTSNLYRLFEEYYCMMAFEYAFLHPDSEFSTRFKFQINHQFSHTHLNQLIQILSRQEAPAKYFSFFASLIEDDVISELFDENFYSVLHLLPYKAELLNHIGRSDDIKGIVRALVGHTENQFDKAGLLIKLAYALHTQNKKSAEFVFQSLLDIVLQHDNILDDELFYELFIQFPNAPKIIRDKATEVVMDFWSDFDDALRVDQVNLMAYHHVEDKWTESARRYLSLQSITDCQLMFPKDRYELYAEVANRWSVELGQKIGCERLASLMEIDRAFRLDEVTKYERFLTAVFIRVDNASLREEILFELQDKKYKDISGWLNQQVDGQSKLKHAVSARNKGLVSYLVKHPEYHFSKVHFQQVSTLAFELESWGILDVFLNTDMACHIKMPKQVAVAAAKNGEDAVVEKVIQLNPQEKIISSSFLAACENNQMSTVQLLVERFDVLPKKLRLAIDHAIQNKHFKLAGFLLEHTETDDELLATRLFHAVRHNEIDVVRFLLRQEDCRNDLISIREARVQAAKHDFHFIFNALLLVRPIHKSEIGTLLNEAVKHDASNILSIVYSQSSSNIKQPQLQKALWLAAEKASSGCIRFLLSGEVRKTFDRKTMDKAFKIAVETGDLTSVKAICQYRTSPSKRLLRSKKAESEHEDIRSYLTQLTRPKQGMASPAKALLQHGLHSTSRDTLTSGRTKDDALLIESGKTHIL